MGEVFENVVWPKDKVVMPGVIDTTTSHIEHPRLVAQRLMNYVRYVGADRVIACSDCGFSTAAGATNVPTEIVYAKLKSMAAGAAIADEMAAEEATWRKRAQEGNACGPFEAKRARVAPSTTATDAVAQAA